MSHIAESRKRAVERLKEHRNEERIKLLKESEKKRLENEKFRDQRKLNIKQWLSESVDRQMDQKILEDAIKHHVDLLEFSDEKLDQSWYELLDGLSEPKIDTIAEQLSTASHIENEDAFLSIHQHIRRPVSATYKFLQATIPEVVEGVDSHDVEALKQYLHLPAVPVISYESPCELDEKPTGVLGGSIEEISNTVNGRNAINLFSRFTSTSHVNGVSDFSHQEINPDDSSKLIKSMFLVGPSNQDIEEFLESAGVTKSYIVSGSSGDSGGKGSESRRKNSNGFMNVSSNLGGNQVIASYLASDRERGLHDVQNKVGKVNPKMLYKTKIAEGVDVNILPLFCFPNDSQLQLKVDLKRQSVGVGTATKTPRRDSNTSRIELKSRQFVFMLTDSNNVHQYGVCMTLPRKFTDGPVTLSAEYCVCIIAAFPYINYILHVISQFEAMDGIKMQHPVAIQDDGYPMQMELRALNDLAIKLSRCFVPRSGQTLECALSVKQCHAEVSMLRLYFEDFGAEMSYYGLLWSLPILLRSLPLDQLILALGCLSTEMSVIVHGPDTTAVTAVISALLCLIRPLKWSGNIIATLPPSMDGYLDSPVPLIAGTTKLPLDFDLCMGTAVIDLSERLVDMHPTEMVVSNTITFPQASKLKESLRKHSENILTCSRKRRIIKTSVGDAAQTSIAGAERPSWLLPIPPELDTGNEKSNLLSVSIKAFMAIVCKHIVSQLDNCLQMNYDSKMKTRNHSILSKSSKKPYIGLSDLPVSSKIPGSGNKPWSNAEGSSVSGDSTDSSILTDAEDILLLMHQGDSGGRPRTGTAPPPAMAAKAQDNIAKFTHRLKNTQMFSYYYSARAQSLQNMKNAQKKQTLITANNGGGGGGASVENILGPELLKGRMPSKTVKIETANIDARQRHGSEENSNRDPLVDLMSIMLSGTLSIRDSQLNSLKESYKKCVYPPGCGSLSRFIAGKRSTVETKMHDSVSGRCNSSGGAISPRSSPDCTLYISASDLDDAYSISDSDNDKDLVWCNGCCDGRANGATCTLLCLEIWKNRVGFVRKQQMVHDIVKKHQNSAVVPLQVQLPNGIIVATSMKVAARKHHRETNSQFRKRQDIKVAAEQKHIEELKGKVAKKAFGGSPGKSQGSYINSMAKYYSVKTRKARRHAVAKALVVLKPIIMRLYWIVVDKRYLRGVIAIQAAARGYVIRNSIEYVVDVLIGRKLYRLMATLILRNWIRKYIVGYYEKFQVRQLNNPTVRKISKVVTPNSIKIVNADESRKLQSSVLGTIRNTKVAPPRTKSPLRSQYSTGNVDDISDGGAILRRYPTNSSVLSGVSTASTAVASVESTHSNSTHTVVLSNSMIPRSNTAYGGLGANVTSGGEADIAIGLDKPKRVAGRTSASTITNTNKQRRAERIAPVVIPPRVPVVNANPVGPVFSQVTMGRAKSPSKNESVSQVPHLSHIENASAVETKLPTQPAIGSVVISGIQNHAVSFAPESLPLATKLAVQENTSTHNNRSNNADTFTDSGNVDTVTPTIAEVKTSKLKPITSTKSDVDFDHDKSFLATNSLSEQKFVQQYPIATPVVNTEEVPNLAVLSQSNKEEESALPSGSTPPLVSHPQTRSNGTVAGIASTLSSSSSTMADAGAVPRASFAHSRRGSRAEEEMLNTERELPEPLAASLGEAGRSELTPQQVRIIYRMFELLRAGVKVIKHSRTSKPHLRTLYCDKDMKVLFWRQSGDSADVDEGVPKKKGLFGRRSSFTRRDVEREIAFSDITAIHTDFTSEVMQRSLGKNYVTVEEGACVISIVTGGSEGRTLDFELDEENFTPLLHSLQILVDFYSFILPQWNGRVGRTDTLDFDMIDDNTNLLHHIGEW